MSDAVEIKAPARARWVDTGVDVRPGERWAIEAGGEWTDWTIASGPEGFSSPRLAAFERLRRAPEAPWFALVATIGRTLSTRVVVGRGVEFSPAAPGRLYLFANDAPFMYWNNKGAVRVRLRRLTDAPA